ATTPLLTDTQTVTGAGDYTSGNYLANVAGTYHWVASYSGDGNNNEAHGTCGGANDSTVVNPAGPAISTVAQTQVVSNHPIHDVAHLTGTFNGTGNITFTVYGPSASPACTTPITSFTVGVTGDGFYTSGDFTPTATGSYYWIASYSGDGNNSMVSGS